MAVPGRPCENDRADLFTGAFIVENEDRANQVRPRVATTGVGAMTEAAGGHEERLAAFDGFRIGRRADGEKVADCFFHGGGLVGRRWSGRGCLLLILREGGQTED